MLSPASDVGTPVIGALLTMVQRYNANSTGIKGRSGVTLKEGKGSEGRQAVHFTR